MITGPEDGPAAGHGRLRASHADRKHVIDTVKIAFADGRLDKDELDDRVAQAPAARTYAELAAVTAGIPAGPAALRSAQLGQSTAVTAAYAVTVRSLAAAIAVLNEQVKTLQGQVEADFGRHPDAEIYLSQPGLGPVLGARIPGEFGNDPDRYASGKARKNYAGTSPITVPPERGRSSRSAPRPAPSTTPSAPAAPGTTPPCANSPAGSSASSTDASRPAPLRRGNRLAAPGKDPPI